MRTKPLRSALFTALLLPASADSLCAGPPQTPRAAQAAHALSKLSDSQRLAAACNRFAAKLYPELRRGGNPTFSPGSIAMALLVLAPALREEAAQQFARLLELPEDLHGEKLLAAASGLLPKNAKTMDVRNDFWLQHGLRLEPEYGRMLTRNLGIGSQQLDLRGQPAAACKVINDYIAKATNQRIERLLNVGDIGKSTSAVLTNAMWFRDAWSDPFESESTKDLPFYLANGTAVTVPTMRSSDFHGYASSEDWLCVTMNFKNSRMRFEVLVPRKGKTLAAAERALLNGKHIPRLTGEKVILSMPRFRTSARNRLKGPLTNIGLGCLFASQPLLVHDRTESNYGQTISEVVHRTWLQVDEQGCEAAAATAVVLAPGAAANPPPAKKVCLNRPFIYGLRDTNSGLLWVTGRIDDPRSNS